MLPPMGLSHIASYLKSKRPDIELALYDADLAPESARFYGQDIFYKRHADYAARVSDRMDPLWREVFDYIKEFAPDVVGISAMTANYTSGMMLAQLIKTAAPGSKVVLGGKHVTTLPELALKNENVDFVVVGEGELIFTDLMDNLNSPEKVPGVYYRNKSGEAVFTGPRKLISNLSELPLPVFFPANDKYDFQNDSKGRECSWELIGARGCPFNCSFCATEHTVRTRSTQHILDEITFMNKVFGIRHFIFMDDSFSFSRERAVSICKALKETGLTWQCNTRVDLLDDELVGLMKSSHCETVNIGIESSSKTTLERIHKKIDPDTIRRAVALLKRYNIKIHGYFIIGFPWETYQDMKATFDFCKELNLYSYAINFAVPLPGTELFSELVESGRIDIEKLDWTRFQQSSYYMNFSDYPDSKWTEMMKSMQKKIEREPRIRLFKHRLTYIWRPYKFMRKVYSKFAQE